MGFVFQSKFLSILPNPVELSHKWIKTDFKYQESEFYYILFDELENRPFDVPTGHTKTYNNKKYTMLQSCTFYRKI